MLFSVCFPVYNTAKYLDECLQYLPSQSGPEGWANAILQATASGCRQKKYDVAHFSVENMATTIATIYGVLC